MVSQAKHDCGLMVQMFVAIKIIQKPKQKDRTRVGPSLKLNQQSQKMITEATRGQESEHKQKHVPYEMIAITNTVIIVVRSKPASNQCVSDVCRVSKT